MSTPLDSITDTLVSDCADLAFAPPVTHVYQPLVYAREGWDQYCARFGHGRRDVLVVGMNPGPYGMAQVGVPFGEVGFVRDWLGIRAPIQQPPRVHPKRPIHGFACRRREVSGQRFWGWAQATCATPERFFAQFFVTNYCPLVFMSASGANVTPDKLPFAERALLIAACDRALLATVAHFRPRWVLGVGHFAELRLRSALAAWPSVVIGRVPHPSPASPIANAGWAPLMTAALLELDVPLP